MNLQFHFNNGENDGDISIKCKSDKQFKIHRFMAIKYSKYLESALRFKETNNQNTSSIDLDCRKKIGLIIFKQIYSGPNPELYNTLSILEHIDLFSTVKMLQISNIELERKILGLCQKSFRSSIAKVDYETFFNVWGNVLNTDEELDKICHNYFVSDLLGVKNLNLAKNWLGMSDALRERLLPIILNYPDNIETQLQQIGKNFCSTYGFNHNMLSNKEEICVVQEKTFMKYDPHIGYSFGRRGRLNKLIVPEGVLSYGSDKDFLIGIRNMIHKMFSTTKK